jgi:dihydroflavonol-4-reductase
MGSNGLVVVTGASGHLGASLVRGLVAAGRTVRCVVRRDVRALEGLPVQQVPGDVLDADSLCIAFRGADIVYHLAAVISLSGDPDGRVARVNVEGTRNVLEACRVARVGRLVQFGSVHAAWTGDVGARGLTAYDRSKAASLDLVAAAVAGGLDAVVVHPSSVLGPHDFKPSRQGDLLWRLANGRMPALLRGGFDWVDSRDVAAGAIAAARQGRRGATYVLSGRYATLRELADIVAIVAGVPAPRMAAPLALAAIGAPFVEAWGRITGTEPLYNREALSALRHGQAFPHDEAAADLGYAPRPLEVTVADTIAWFRSRAAG